MIPVKVFYVFPVHSDLAGKADRKHDGKSPRSGVITLGLWASETARVLTAD